MVWDIILTLIGALGGMETLKWFVDRKNARQLSRAKAEVSQTEAESAREHLYEETIIFLQNQLKEKEQLFAEQSAALRKSMQEELRLTRLNGELEVRYLSTRCDIRECSRRLPPLPGTTKETT